MLPDGGARPTSAPGPTTAARGKPGGAGGRAPAKRLPRLGFLKGAALGVLVVLPLVAAGVWVLARAGIGNPDVTMVEALRMATLFAGGAAVLTAGGVGRLAAHASITPGGLRTSIIRAVRTQAVAGAGLVIIAAIPHGELPTEPWGWAWFAVAGALGGAVSGLIIGLVCGAPVNERLPTVPELARMIPRLLPVVGEIGRKTSRAPAVTGEIATPSAPAPGPAPSAVTEPNPPPAAGAEAAVPMKPMELRGEPVALPLPEPEPEPEAEPEPELTPPPEAAGPPADRDAARRQRKAGRKALMVESARQEHATPRPKLVKPARHSAERSKDHGEGTSAPTTPVATPTATPSSTTTGGGGATPLPMPVPLGESMPVRTGAIDPESVEETSIEGRIGDTVDVGRTDPGGERTVTGVTDPEVTVPRDVPRDAPPPAPGSQADEDAETAVKGPA